MFAKDPELVQRELYLMPKNAVDRGVTDYAPLAPVIITRSEREKLEQSGRLYDQFLRRIYDVVRDPNHPKSPAMQECLGISGNPVLEEILAYSKDYGDIPRGVIRPDMIPFPIEINLSWPGWVPEADIIAEVLAENSLWNMYVEEQRQRGITIEVPGGNLNKRLLLDELIEYSGKEKPAIAIVVPPQSNGVTKNAWLLNNYIRGEGFTIGVFTPDQLECRDGGVYYGQQKYDVVYRKFEGSHMLRDLQSNQGYMDLVRAALRGDVAMVNPPHNELLAAKSTLAVLFDDEFRECIGGDLVDELREEFPYTVNLGDVDSNTLEYIKSHKDEFVGKKIKDLKALGAESENCMIVGIVWKNEQEWRKFIQDGYEKKDAVVQNYHQHSEFEIPEIVKVDGELKLGFTKKYRDSCPFYFSNGRGRVSMGGIINRFSMEQNSGMVHAGGGIHPFAFEK